MKYLRVLTVSLIFSLLAVTGSFSAENTLDKIPMSRTKLDFLWLYKTQWDSFGLPWKLKKAIDDAFAEQTENFMWGTVGLRLASNYDNIQEKIQQAAEFKFNADYDKFMSELEGTWGEKLRDNIIDFYKRQNEAMYFELKDNPMAQAYLRQDYDRITEDNGRAAMSRISDELSAKYGTFKTSGAGIIGGGLMILARKQLTKYVTKILARKVTGTALGKLAGTAIPVIGWAMLAWSVWDIYSMATDAEETISRKMYESYNKMYSEEVPLVYWEGMESYVKDAYVFAYESVLVNANKGKSLSANTLVKELSQELTIADQRFFADRLAVIQDISDGKEYTLDDVLTRHGNFIRDAKHRDFESFAAILMESDELPQDYPPKPPVSPDVQPKSPVNKVIRIYEGH